VKINIANPATGAQKLLDIGEQSFTSSTFYGQTRKRARGRCLARGGGRDGRTGRRHAQRKGRNADLAFSVSLLLR